MKMKHLMIATAVCLASAFTVTFACDGHTAKSGKTGSACCSAKTAKSEACSKDAKTAKSEECKSSKACSTKKMAKASVEEAKATTVTEVKSTAKDGSK